MDNLNAEDIKNSKMETLKHISNVQNVIHVFMNNIALRGLEHDYSKLSNPELETFAVYGPKLKETTYGSDEYNQYLEEMKIALDNHYSSNRHHPEHFENGIDDMNLIDIVEMFCDWKASTMRHDDGNLEESINYNSKRFNMTEQLKQIFLNTEKEFGGEF